jgi:hypothetical protein
MTVKDFDKLVKSIMADAEKDGEPVSLEDAREMARMEIKANEGKNRYEKSEKPRKPRTVKKDPEKVAIIADVCELLRAEGYDAQIVNDTIQIDFGLFSLTLVKHKPPKK